ncbi:hypothetical protein H6P81_006264 [Aristolochia fimbriata]|uniref:SANT domain-containing protein n=1 Tax=Aristolochia fimbriata TaxID=158543 RepID=A0AAV7EWT4_ARIFI|nr:hypothetical protein H6P81_006264 [Aristolochia fimbriata]
MPPEPLQPWDRKEFIREKRHDRSDGVASVARWRDSYHGPREVPREESRRPPGPGKQGNYLFLPEESGYGGPWLRPGERMVEDESCRPSVSRYGRGGYGRENKGSFGGTKDWKGHHYYHHHYQPHHPWEPASQHDGRVQRSVDDDHHVLTSYPSSHPPHSDLETTSSWEQPLLKDLPEKMPNASDGLASGHVSDKDNSLGSLAWKPLKWSRSGSLTSRGSGSFTLSDDAKVELPPGKSSPVQSPSTGDLSAAGAAGTSYDETCPRKKQRLGWGQGLAKYEKQKVEGPEEVACKNISGSCTENEKSNHYLPVQTIRSPKVLSISECTSPATPSSVACSSSPGMEDKTCTKLSVAYGEVCLPSGSPGQAFSNLLEGFCVSPPEYLDLDSLNSIGPLLVDLLQSDDASTGDSNFVRSTALNKLLLVKSNILKAVEKTEGEIDAFENELKSLDSVSAASAMCLTTAEAINTNESASKQLALGPLCKVLVDMPSKIKDDNMDSPVNVVKAGHLQTVESGVLTSELGKDECSADVEKEEASVSGTDCFHESRHSPCTSPVAGLLSEVDGSSIAAVIFNSNKDSARKASDVFNKLLPVDPPKSDIWKKHARASATQIDLLIKERLANRKSFQRFKERVLSLKFRAFHHLWKEDMRLLSLRKSRAKSQKRFELGCRSLQVGYQKHRSSIRSRFTSPGGNLTLVPTMEIVDFTSKLLSDSQIKSCRGNLKMPALILDDKEKRQSRFVTSNGLVEDPCAVEKERTLINPWTSEEKEVFMEMLATFGKDFAKIASFLSHKTTADCIEFYYKNHKSESFEKIKKRLELRKEGSCFPTNAYLVTSGKKWNREANSASLDMLGAASVIAAHAGKSVLSGRNYSCREGGHLELTGSVDNNLPRNDSEAVAADVLTGICGGMSSEAMSSCITSSVDPGEGFHSRNSFSVVDRPFTPEVSQNIDEEDTCSDDSCGELDSVDWTDEEKSAFIMAFRSYGKDFMSISRCVGSRSRDQCKIFFSKARKCLGLDVMHPTEGTPISDANGGRSDSEEDAGVVEMDSAICSTQSCSKMEVDLPLGSNEEGCQLQTDLDGTSEKDEMGGSNHEELDSVIDKPVSSDHHEVKLELDCNAVKEPLCDESKGAGPNALHNETMNTDAVLGGTLSFEAESGINVTEIQRSADFKQENTVQGRCGKGFDFESESQKVILSDHGPEAKIEQDVDFCKSSPLMDPNESKKFSEADVRESIQADINFVEKHERETSFQVPASARNSQMITWRQKENCPSEPSISDIPGSSSIVHYANHFSRRTESTLNFEEHGSGKGKKSGTEVYQQYLLQKSCLNQVDQPGQILRGYPLQALHKKATKCEPDSNGEKLVVLQNHQKNLTELQELHHDMNNGLKTSMPTFPVSDHSYLPKNHGHQSDVPVSSFSHASDMSDEQACKRGDVKLFGQILSHLAPLKQLSSSQGNGEKVLSPKSKSICLKFSESRMDGASALPKRTEPTSRYLCIDEYPMRSYGFWDGTRIQTGLPTLPDSAVLSSKYSGAVADYHHLRRIVPTSKELVSSSNGVGDGCQIYRSGYDAGNVKPFGIMDVKQQERILSELQKQERILCELQKQRNGYEGTGVLGYQQGVVGMNVVGGGILVGGSCTGVSDPVAAIKMHYAAAAAEKQRYGGGSGGIVREEDPWRGDVGR